MTHFKSAAIAERIPASLDNNQLNVSVERNVSFDVQSIVESERMFLLTLAVMTSVLGAICVYFVLNL